MNDRNYYIHRAAEIMNAIQYATVATASTNGHPWNSPVFAVRDVDMCLYWFSDKAAQHSKNIRATNEAFIAIYDSTCPEGTGEGVYLQVRVEEVRRIEEIRHARQLKKGIADNPRSFLGASVRRVYKATPHKIWINAVQIEGKKFIRDYRIELPIDEVRHQLTPDGQ
jgi:hypothetical protein